MAGVDYRHGRPISKKRGKKTLKHEEHPAKRGRFGKGTDLGGDTFNYFLGVLKESLDDFSNPEDKEIFIDNVFEQTAGKEIIISCNHLGSRAIEKFLPFANDKVLLRFTYAFSMDLRNICCDEFGSHVFQQLVAVVTTQIQKADSGESDKDDGNQCKSPDMVVRFKNWLQQISKYVINNLEEFVWDKHANFIIRTILESISGLPIGSTLKANKTELKSPISAPVGNMTVSPIPDGFDLVKDCGKRMRHMPELLGLVLGNHTSGLLQTVLCSLHKVDGKHCCKLLKRLIDCYNSSLMDSSKTGGSKITASEYIPEIFVNEAASCLMDVMICVSSEKLFTQIYAKFFMNGLKPLSEYPYANYCVQNLIKRCPEKVQFEAIFDELSTHFEVLVKYKKHGVLLALAQACERLSAKQAEFIKELQSALHCAEPADRRGYFPLLVSHMVTYETWCQSEDSKKPLRNIKVSLHGSLVLQTMLNFPGMIKIVRYLLNVDKKNLESLFCDPRGSHIADAYFRSKTIGEESHEKMFQKLQGMYVGLALSTHGSRVLDVIWAWSSLKNKKLILEELSPSETVINSMICGYVFAEKSHLSLFKRSPKVWEEIHTRQVRKRKLFSDIISSA